MANVSSYYDDDAIIDALNNTSSAYYTEAVLSVEVEAPEVLNSDGRSVIRVTTEYWMMPETVETILSEAEGK